MLTLYYDPSCPFCQRVLQMADNLNVSLDLKDIEEDETALAELLEKGGMKQVPFLVDTESATSMYEASDIIDYMRENGKKGVAVAATKPRIHVSGSTCVSCEG